MINKSKGYVEVTISESEIQHMSVLKNQLTRYIDTDFKDWKNHDGTRVIHLFLGLQWVKEKTKLTIPPIYDMFFFMFDGSIFPTMTYDNMCSIIDLASASKDGCIILDQEMVASYLKIQKYLHKYTEYNIEHRILNNILKGEDKANRDMDKVCCNCKRI